MDDGSTDHTVDVVRREQERWGRRLQLLQEAHGERSAARNLGIDAASGEYVAFLDSDDLWRTNHLEALLRALREQSHAVAAVADYGILSTDGRVVRDHVQRTTENGGPDRRRRIEGDYAAQLRALVRQDIIIHPSEVLASRSALLSTGGFKQDVIGSEDWLLWVELTRAGELFLTHQATVWLRRSPDNTFSQPQQFAAGAVVAAERVVETGVPHEVGYPTRLSAQSPTRTPVPPMRESAASGGALHCWAVHSRRTRRSSSSGGSGYPRADWLRVDR